MQRAQGKNAGEDHTPPAPFAAFNYDLRVLRDALLASLRATLNGDAVERAASLTDAMDRLRRRPSPDLVLLDHQQASADGSAALAQLARAAPGVAVFFVTSQPEGRLMGSVVRLGPTIDTDPEGGAGGDTLEGPDAVGLLQSLTRQQARILQLVCEGKYNKQIAYHLDITEGTVKAHLTAILRKLNVQNRTQAVLIAQNARFGRPARRGLGNASALQG